MNTYRYNAFISYRHHPVDTACAKKVQQGLEHFRIPKEIRNKYQITRIERIFRDEEELEITSDLSKKIETALEDSEYLIVICSPRYNESEWCQKEIETFLKNNDRDHILSVLCEGEPPQIFPEILLHKTVSLVQEDGTYSLEEVSCEPLATDFRGDKKTIEHIELPRLASALIGCGYDELIMRQERYRRKRLYSILSAVFTLAFIVLSYLLWSNLEIRKNYRQSLINASKISAKESMDAFSEQDRYTALSASLSALPSKELNRPVIDQAVNALTFSSYAYTTPFQYFETKRFDPPNDISFYFVTRDNRYLVFMDKTGTFFTYDLVTYEETASFRLSEKTLPSNIEEGKDGQLITYVDGSVIAVDIPTGEELWRCPLKYQALGSVCLSHNGKYIAAADAYAVQILTTDGEPYLSLPLNEESDSYIVDLCWSEDDSMIAVKLRMFSPVYEIGIFSFDTGEYENTGIRYSDIPYFTFRTNNTLYVLADDAEEKSYSSDDLIDLFQTTYHLHAFNGSELLYKTAITTSSQVPDIFLEETENMLYLALGNNVYGLKHDGTIGYQYSLSDSVVSFRNIDKSSFEVVTADGYKGILHPEKKEFLSTHAFPSESTAIRFCPGSSARESKYVLLKDNALMLYENVFDETLKLFDGEAFTNVPDHFLLDEQMFVLKADGKIWIYDLSTDTMTSSITIPAGSVYHLLSIEEEHIYVMRIDTKTAEIYVQCYTKDGKMEKETLLSASAYLIFNEFLRAPLSQDEALFLDDWYCPPSSIAVQNGVLYIHDSIAPERIILFDLKRGSETSVDVSMAGYEAMITTGYTQPSPLYVSENGTKLFTIMSPEGITDEDAVRTAVLFDLETEKATVLDGIPDQNGLAVLKEGKLIYSGENEIFVCSENGELLETIPYSNETAIALDVHKGKIYALCDHDLLKIYKDGRAERSIPIFNRQPYLNAGGVSFTFTEDRLYLFCYSELNVISLDGEEETPLYTLTTNAIAYSKKDHRIIVYSYDPEHFINRYFAGAFSEYTVEELIERGQKQLDAFLSSRK